jgi:hypothetical protein
MLCTDYHAYDNPLVQSDLEVVSIDLSLPHSPETELDSYLPIEMTTLPSAVTGERLYGLSIGYRVKASHRLTNSWG